MHLRIAHATRTSPRAAFRRPDDLHSGFTLTEAAIVVMLLGLLVGGIMMGESLVEIYRVHAQIAQIGNFDEAVANFHEKYEGLPGDLLAVQADRQGLPAGDGTPGHGDGDGKISPCNLGWQYNLGCETALFWSHLFISGMISDNFTADSRFTNSRLGHVGSMLPYLPGSPLAPGVYVAVWNTDASQPSAKPRMPFGNYYEISRILGTDEEKLIDDDKAMTPMQAKSIDTKMDDGNPIAGRVVVNGQADWPRSSWGTYAKPGLSSCIGPDEDYNVSYFLRARAPICHLAIMLQCCKK